MGARADYNEPTAASRERQIGIDSRRQPAPVRGLALLIVQLVSIFFILRSTFKLNVKRTFAPFGVYVALILAQLGLAVFIIKPFIAEAFVLPTKSMSPTIEPGDRFVVNKL